MIWLNDEVITPSYFPDKTLLLKTDIENCKDRRAIVKWCFENNEELVILIFLTKHLKDHGVDEITLYMPYIPNARMDRVKHQDEVFTLKYFADVINSLNFKCVLVRDPHSNVSCALINNLCYFDPAEPIHEAVSKIGVVPSSLVMYYPDEGAMKRYSEMINRPYAFGVKRRDWDTGKIQGITLINEEVVKNKTVLIVDDICSKGGTFYHSAKALKEAGAYDIYLYVTHCENTIFEGELLKSDLIKHIYTTDSILTKEHEKITVL